MYYLYLTFQKHKMHFVFNTQVFIKYKVPNKKPTIFETVNSNVTN